MERQSAASLGERDDDAIGPGLLNDATEVLGVIHHADDDVSESRLPLDLLDDRAPQSALPEDQHPFADVTEASDSATHAAQPEQEADDDEEARHERATAKRRLGDKAVTEAHRTREGVLAAVPVPRPHHPYGRQIAEERAQLVGGVPYHRTRLEKIGADDRRRPAGKLEVGVHRARTFGSVSGTDLGRDRGRVDEDVVERLRRQAMSGESL